VLVGIFSIGFATHSANGELLARLIAVVGGAYVIVRGLDNFDKGLSKADRKVWEKMFPKKAQPGS